MGAAHSKRRASPDCYRRIWAGKLYRAPKGTRWTKPSAIVDALQILAVTEGAISVQSLLEYAIQCHNQLTIKPWKKGEDRKVNFPTGNRGHVFLEYAWARFNRDAVAMSERDIVSAHSAGKIDRWYDSLTPRVTKTVGPTTATVRNKKQVKRSFKKAKFKAEALADKAKAVGDKLRAEVKDANKRQAVYVEAYRAEETLVNSFKAMLESN